MSDWGHSEQTEAVSSLADYLRFMFCFGGVGGVDTFYATIKQHHAPLSCARGKSDSRLLYAPALGANPCSSADHRTPATRCPPHRYSVLPP